MHRILAITGIAIALVPVTPALACGGDFMSSLEMATYSASHRVSLLPRVSRRTLLQNVYAVAALKSTVQASVQ